MLIIKTAISIGESVKKLLVPHNTVTFFSDGGIYWFLAHQNIFFARAPPITKFNTFNRVKYICHTCKYLKIAAIMESPSTKKFLDCFF